MFSSFGFKSTKAVLALGNKTYMNSQTLPALEAKISPLAKNAKIATTIVITDGALSPATGPLGTALDVESIAEPGEISLYVVRDGDSLSAIAKMFDVSVNTILWANDMKKGEPIHKGQMLTILPITGVRHVVKKGDTIKNIAVKFGGDAKEIAVFNGIAETTSLQVGTTLLIPDGEIKAVTTTTKKTTNKKSGEKTWGTNAPEQKGYYIRPLSGGRKSQGLHGYNGIDIAAPTGTPIFASARGTVIVAKSGGWGGGYGSYVVIRHDNGTQTLYAHMSRVATSVGATVAQGDTIGSVGNTGKSTGPHLHFEVRGAKNPF